MISLNNNICKIISVYKEFTFGFGDYLRGCLFLSQLSIHQKKEFLMNYFSHPIFEFLEGGQELDISEEKLLSFPKEMKNKEDYFERIKFLNNHSSSSLFIKTNSFPMKPLFPLAIYRVLKQIEPKLILRENVIKYMKELGLASNEFIVLHFRIGDDILLEGKSIPLKYIQRILFYLKKNMFSNKKYLLLGDNNIIKKIIHSYFPYSCYKQSKIVHLGISLEKERECILETLTEFFLMKHCSKIISFSTYLHRTSFGEMASILFQKPFQYYSLLDKKISIRL